MVDWRRLFRRLGVVLNLRDPPNLPPYGWSYFDHLVAMYVALNVPEKRADAVIEKSHDTPDDLKWGDVFLLESVVLTLQPDDAVCRSAWIIRERLRETAAASIYDKYVESGIPKEADTPAKITLLRADLTRILDVLHWHYALIPIRERIRRSLTFSCILWVIAYTSILGGVLVWCQVHNRNFLALVACVLYFGLLGGFVSSQRRMESIPPDTDPLLSVFGLDNAGYYLFLSPLLGAIFALVLTMMFMGGILKGTIFPQFVMTHPRGNLSFFHQAGETLPTTNEQYAMLFVWCFLAGFAERLVPDSLDRLGSRLTGSKQASPTPSSPAVVPPPPNRPPGGDDDDGSGSKQGVSSETIKNALHSGELPPPIEGDHD